MSCFDRKLSNHEINVIFSAVYILVSFKVPFHCMNKTIPSEISMSGDYLRLDVFALPWGFDLSDLSKVGNLTKKISWRPGFDWFLKIFPRGCPGGW